MAASSARASASCRATAAVSSPVDWLEVPALDITRSCVLWGRYQGRVTTGGRPCEGARRHNAPMALDQTPFLLILAGGLYLFVSERVRIDVSATLILLALVVTGVLDRDQAMSACASEPAFIVDAAFVIS